MPVNRNVGGKNTTPTSKVIDRKKAFKNGPVQNTTAAPIVQNAGGGDAAAVGHDDDDAIAAFFQEMRQDDGAKAHEIRKVSLLPGQKYFKLGPDYVDEEYFECTPVPLYQQVVPILNYDTFLEKSSDELVVITPIRPQTFSALFAFYRDRGPALNWDPNLTDLEEDCFFQEVINFPTSKLAYAVPRERKRDMIKKKRVKVFQPNGDYVIKTRLNINLQESQTVVLLELKGTLILESDEKFPLATQKNEKYLLMVQHHLESDSYANDYAQSFENYKLSRYSDNKIRGCIDVGTDCHFYFIEDDYKKVDAEDVRRKIRENDELTAKTLAEKAKLEIPESGWKSSDSEDSSDAEEDLMSFRVDISKYKEEDEDDMNRQLILEDASEDELPMSSEDEQEFEINFDLQAVYERKKYQAKLKGPRIYPDISFSMIALERIICMDSQQQKQADMRGFTEPEEVRIEIIPLDDDTDKKEEMDEDAIVDLLIQQHRMQEQMEKSDNEAGSEKDVAIIIPQELTDADLERIQAEVNDDGISADIEEIKIELPTKQASIKIEEPTVAEEPEEKDEFDLAIEGALIELRDERIQDSESRRGGDGQYDERPDSPSKDRREDESLAISDRYEKFTKDDGQGSQSIPLSDGEGEVVLGNIKCEWDDKDEKNADSKEELAELKATEEIIDEERLNLVEATDEYDEISIIRAKDYSEKKESGAELGIMQFPELVKPTDQSEKEEEVSAKDDDQDDISSESDIEDDSRLSDHKGLEDDKGASSEAHSDDSAASKKEIPIVSVRKSSIGKIFVARKEKEKLEEDIDTLDGGPNLRQYWQFKTIQTARKEVTDIALHPNNGNLIAVSYGSFHYGRDGEEGLVCIWNAKNNQSPERTYHLKSPSTTLAFSEFTPYVLAVGMLDGNIALYDVRESDSVILGSTYNQEDKHLGPIWQIYWLVVEDTTNDQSISESMLSLGDDGYLKRWSMTKGLESSMVMKVMRSTMQVPGRREKRSESLITTLSNAYSVCFFPDNTDLFLLGTEEGFIHKCGTSYKDSFLGSYVGHTGPVYRICFSVFDDMVFVSCGGDWTVKIWKTDHPVALLSMHTGHRTIFDVACSLYSSTVFICCAEFHIEVWDLSQNTLEPVVEFKPAFDVGLRKAAFNGLLNSVIIGDDEGGISIFGLRNFPKPPFGKNAQNDALMEALLPGFKRRQKESTVDLTGTQGLQSKKANRNKSVNANTQKSSKSM